MKSYNSYPHTYLKFENGQLLVQANYNDSLEIGQLFVISHDRKYAVPVLIESFRNMNPLQWIEIELEVAKDRFNRLTREKGA